MKYTIRPIDPSEIQKVNTLISNAFNIDPNLSIQYEFLNQTNCHCFVAASENEIIGTGSLHIIQKTNRKMGLIEDVVVAPISKGNGVGKKLVEALVTQSKESGCYKTMLNTSENTAPFYEKSGFSKSEIQMIIRH